MLTKVTFYENIRKPFPLYSGIILEHIIIHIMADVGKHYTFQAQFKTHLQFNAFGILSFMQVNTKRNNTTMVPYSKT